MRGGTLIFETTPSQTVGPYFAIGLPFDVGPFAVAEGTPGAIHITGTVYDGAGVPIPDFLLETWQADPEGRFADIHGQGGPSQLDGFRGFARYGLEDGDGNYDIVTVKPGLVPGLAGAIQAPHIDVSVFARGMLHRTVTRIYFADETEANASDPVLARVPVERRPTLLAEAVAGGYRFDIRFQGPRETVFFAV
ncbi:MAG: protocatechuate 3,4-dioxygenase subunit alpha [Solirubrobacterales bacterium]|nr:protocatechuate 3,4-dioxygenase subunit alpha [Solirubrobacterales bacterium]MBV8944647.1 protocatechuate 3,4-dioxygenase subunit alpha [Solirubrobacterales bacterium]MBV9365832.1 protocatechuate 3,4-dioxygenase subunit alpha [Solirubrobacterales bacterium]MBV9681808.1 protocatechuate 3,4-dioxygenase subunit alpha [Solirubrobacterales bacterium]